eukprot:m.111343 g.111343  ORF g.111343 m.111343 type:complete len:730 (-) comp28114_c0_seq1:145-2334(-)
MNTMTTVAPTPDPIVVTSSALPTFALAIIIILVLVIAAMFGIVCVCWRRQRRLKAQSDEVARFVNRHEQKVLANNVAEETPSTSAAIKHSGSTKWQKVSSDTTTTPTTDSRSTTASTTAVKVQSTSKPLVASTTANTIDNPPRRSSEEPKRDSSQTSIQSLLATKPDKPTITNPEQTTEGGLTANAVCIKGFVPSANPEYAGVDFATASVKLSIVGNAVKAKGKLQQAASSINVEHSWQLENFTHCKREHSVLTFTELKKFGEWSFQFEEEEKVLNKEFFKTLARGLGISRYTSSASNKSQEPKAGINKQGSRRLPAPPPSEEDMVPEKRTMSYKFAHDSSQQCQTYLEFAETDTDAPRDESYESVKDLSPKQISVKASVKGNKPKTNQPKPTPIDSTPEYQADDAGHQAVRVVDTNVGGVYYARTKVQICDASYMGGEAYAVFHPPADAFLSALLNQVDTILRKYLLQGSQIHVMEYLTQGEFGMVHRGRLVESNEIVAIKLCKLDDPKSLQSMKTEAAVQGSFEHKNVCALRAFCYDPLCLVLEWCNLGSLEAVLEKQDLSSDTCWGIANDIALGLQYLATKKYVHRDIAARNVLLTDDYSAKLSDFGMSRETEEGYYISKNLGKAPVRWMAPEAIGAKFTAASDVWSYGILLWELYSDGCTPYFTTDCMLETVEEVLNFILTGEKMPPPKKCSLTVSRIMELCWSFKPDARPTATEIVEWFSQTQT